MCELLWLRYFGCLHHFAFNDEYRSGAGTYSFGMRDFVSGADTCIGDKVSENQYLAVCHRVSQCFHKIQHYNVT